MLRRKLLSLLVAGLIAASGTTWAVDQFIYGNTQGVREYWCSPLLDPSTGDFLTSSPTLAAGDATIQKDWSGSFSPTTNTLQWVGGGWVCVQLTQAELQARVVAVNFIDQSVTKEWLDTAILGFSGGADPATYYNRFTGGVNDTD